MPYGLLSNEAELQKSLQRGLLMDTPAAPQAPAAPPAPAPRRSLWDRVKDGTGNVLGSVHRGITGGTPDGFEGLLTPEEIESARPGLLQSLIGAPDAPSSSERYEANLLGLIGKKEALEAKQLEQQMLQGRAEVEAMFPPPPGETPAAAIGRLKNMYAAYAANGDMEMMGKIGEVLKSIGGEGTQATLHREDLGDRIVWSHPYTGEIVRTEMKGREPGATDGVSQGERFSATERNSQLSNERGMARDYRAVPVIAKAYEVARAASAAKAMLRMSSPPADLGGIIAITRLFDPGSVAREGEVTLTMGAASFPTKLWQWLQKYNSGKRLTPQLKREFEAVVDGIVDEHEGIVEPHQARFGKKVRRLNEGQTFQIDSSFVAPSPFEGLNRGPSQVNINRLLGMETP